MKHQVSSDGVAVPARAGTSSLARDGTFVLDGVTVPAIRTQLMTALDAWYRLHPGVTPELWVSSDLHANVLWAVRQVCRSLPEPVKVYTEHRDKRTGRLA